MMALVTASDTAVRISDSSSMVGFICVANAAAHERANPSFCDRLANCKRI